MLDKIKNFAIVLAVLAAFSAAITAYSYAFAWVFRKSLLLLADLIEKPRLFKK